MRLSMFPETDLGAEEAGLHAGDVMGGTVRTAGDVAEAFILDDRHKVRAILGPVGGGKSVSCILDCFKNAAMMPVCRDGVIRYRVAIIGETYGQIERNLLPTWTEWTPRDGGWTEAEFTGGGGRHAKHAIRYMIERGGQDVEVHFEAIFAAVGELSVEDFMRGFEVTAFWLYEMDLLPEAVLDQALFRVGRYPKMWQLPPGANFRDYVIGDLNAPDFDSWFYRRFEEDRPDEHIVYKQPSGVSKRAENLKNLKPGYYDSQIATLGSRKNGKHLVRRFVHAQYGPSLHGEPVYSEYNDDIHLSPEDLKPLPGLAIIAGLDAGLRRPAMVYFQVTPAGQYRILGEVLPGRVGTQRFAEAVKIELAAVAPGFQVQIGYSDPVGFFGADKEAGESAWSERLMLELGFPIEPAPSNELTLRLDAVADELTHMVDAHTPALLVSRRCKMLRKGFASHYRYQKLHGAADRDPALKPEKNEYSDPHDALQYGILGHKGRYGAITTRREANRNRPGSRTHAARAGGGNVVVRNSTNLFGRRA